MKVKVVSTNIENMNVRNLDYVVKRKIESFYRLINSTYFVRNEQNEFKVLDKKEILICAHEVFALVDLILECDKDARESYDRIRKVN